MRLLLVLWLSSLCCSAFTQEEVSRQNVIWASFAYGYQEPWGDLSQRFGGMFGLTASMGYLTQNGLFASLNHSLLFGNQVKEDVLANLRTLEGGIIGRDQQFADIFLRSRGNHSQIQLGYFLNKAPSDGRRGLLVSLGIGWLRHKVRIVDDFDAVVQVLPPYDRGYDLLTSGFTIEPSLGYLHLSENRLINFMIQIQSSFAFTANRRGINYGNQNMQFSNRFEGLLGGKIGWIIPIYL